MLRSQSTRIDLETLAERLRGESALLQQLRARSVAAQADSKAARNGDGAEPAEHQNGHTGDPAPHMAEPEIERTPGPARLKRALREAPLLGPGLAMLWRQRHRFSTTVAPLLSAEGKKTLLFVGDWDHGWGQLELVRAFDALRMLSDVPVRMVLAGLAVSVQFLDLVRAEVQSLGLADDVLLCANPNDRQLRYFYEHADLFVSLATEEAAFSRRGAGFDQAIAWDVPIVAFCPETKFSEFGNRGLILDTHDPDLLAGLCKLMLEEPALRRATLELQRTALPRLNQLSARVRRAAQAVRAAISTRTLSVPLVGGWRIEGPFDSSYSLAVVNRELATALTRQKEQVGLVSRDGPGPFPPNSNFVKANPSVRQMWRAGLTQQCADVALRNTYPPWVSSLKGELRGLVCYAWEESGFPREYVEEFNRNLDFVAVTSSYVAKTLRDNGVRAPIRVVGDGIDQITRIPLQAAARAAVSDQYGLGDRFCFLHVSSCLPRKGVDVLLAAWREAFDARDDVVLVIKASQNQHHAIDQDLAALRAADPDIAPIVLINRDLESEELRALYARGDVLVAPSRGEGFGLPIAEVMALGKPVITTGFGGQMDFCSDQNAWLCDYDFSYARSHLSSPYSVWVEPRRSSLIACLQAARAASKEDCTRLGAAAQAKLRTEFGWAEVAARLRRAVEDVKSPDQAPLALPKVGWISTWNSRCGIADYSQNLVCAFPEQQLSIFANWNAEHRVGVDTPNVRRSWEQSWRDPLDQLYADISAAQVDAVVIQFNFGFYDLNAFSRLVGRLADDGKHVYVSLHSTADVERPDLTIRLADAAPALGRARRVLVHSVDDLNCLKAHGLVDNVTLLPFGLPSPPKQICKDPAQKKVVATFGYLLEHKGLPQLIEAIAVLRRDGIDVDLLMLNALYPAKESERMKVVCEEAIARHGLGEHVALETEFLAADEVLRVLGGADLIVFPYQHTQESASAAVRMGLASLTAVAVSPLPIFDDVAPVVHRLSGFTPGHIAEDIRELLQAPERRLQLERQQTDWVAAHQWKTISTRLYNIIRGEAMDDLLRR